MSKNFKIAGHALYFCLLVGLIISLVQVESGPGFYERFLWYFVRRSPILFAAGLLYMLIVMFLTRKPKVPK